MTVHAADDPDHDPALAPFLALLAREIETHPEMLVPLPEALIAQALELTKGMIVDLDEPIAGDVGL